MGAEWYEAQGIEVRDTDRGGRVTYHGPGQLVAYPIVALEPYGDDVHEYVRRLERVMIGALGRARRRRRDDRGPDRRLDRRALPPPMRRGDVARRSRGGAKIGSIGVHVSRGVTTHGLAVNVNNDLQPFEWIVPCGIEGCRMTSLTRELGAEQDLDAFAATVAAPLRARSTSARRSRSAPPSWPATGSAALEPADRRGRALR